MIKDKDLKKRVAAAKEAAVQVLLYNADHSINYWKDSQGRRWKLPSTSDWRYIDPQKKEKGIHGYWESYTRDLMFTLLGILVSGNKELMDSLRSVFLALAANQSRLGHIPSIVNDRENRGASDTTPLFILGLGFFRQHQHQKDKDFLEDALRKAMTWMEYQSPEDRVLVAQLPTSDWRDELWVMGYGLYVNTIVYSYLRFFGQHERADWLCKEMSRFTITGGKKHGHVHEGLVVKRKPYYALWSYKIYSSERFDLLGNSLAILAGMAPRSRAKKMIAWVEKECRAMRATGDLAAHLDLPPNFFPFIREQDPDWRPRYMDYNRPGIYHNGGIWPFVCAFYTAALVTAGKYRLAEKKLDALTKLVKEWHYPEHKPKNGKVDYGFSEWLNPTDGKACCHDWHSWSAAMYLYAAFCVEHGKTPFFDQIREKTCGPEEQKGPAPAGD